MEREKIERKRDFLQTGAADNVPARSVETQEKCALKVTPGTESRLSAARQRPRAAQKRGAEGAAPCRCSRASRSPRPRSPAGLGLAALLQLGGGRGLRGGGGAVERWSGGAAERGGFSGRCGAWPLRRPTRVWSRARPPASLPLGGYGPGRRQGRGEEKRLC